MLIVTIAALVMAASLGWFAYRLLQQEQRRSEARVALLAAALDAEPLRHAAETDRPVTSPSAPAAPPAPRIERPALPTVVLLEGGPRSIGAFASESDPRPEPVQPEAHLDVEHPAGEPTLAGRAREADVAPRTSGLFADVPSGRPADTRGPLALGAVLLVATLALGYAWFGLAAPAGSAASAAPGVTAPRGGAPGAVSSVAEAGGVPLELRGLRHERRGDALIVHGVVRNPVAGSDRVGVLARVALLDGQGRELADSRGALAARTLRPGADSTFTVQVPFTLDVRRYRVTFGTTQGAPVPHADKRS